VREVADLAIAKAKIAPQVLELRWSAFLGGEIAPAHTATPAKKAHAAKKQAPTAAKPKAAEPKPKQKGM
jgi:hypothetical protein